MLDSVAGVPEPGLRGRSLDAAHGSGPYGVGLRGFKSHLPHHMASRGAGTHAPTRFLWSLEGGGGNI